VRLFSRPQPPHGPATPPPPPVTFDPAAGDPQGHQMMRWVAAGDWRSAHQFLEGVTGWDDRSYFLRLISRWDPFPEEWISATGGSQLAFLARGMQRVQAAWRARGSGKGETVTEQGWKEFFAVLNLAEDDLARAAELVPEDPVPWTSRITVARGLEMSKEEVLRRLGEVNARAPGFRPAYVTAVVSVAQKWRGSHALMFDVAREANRTLPAGNPGRVAIAWAHALRFQYYLGWEKARDTALGYYKDPAVGAEILGAAEACVLSPGFPETLDSPWPRADFALSLALAGDGDIAYRHRSAALFPPLGDSPPVDTLWRERYGGKEGEQFARIRQLSFRAAAAGPTQPAPASPSQG